MAGTADTVPNPLHADLFLVAQSGGTMVWPDHATRHSPGLIPQRSGTGAEDRRFRSALQPHCPAVRLDRDCRVHPQQNHQTLFTNFRDTTLVWWRTLRLRYLDHGWNRVEYRKSAILRRFPDTKSPEIRIGSEKCLLSERVLGTCRLLLA